MGAVTGNQRWSRFGCCEIRRYVSAAIIYVDCVLVGKWSFETPTHAGAFEEETVLVMKVGGSCGCGSMSCVLCVGGGEALCDSCCIGSSIYV